MLDLIKKNISKESTIGDYVFMFLFASFSLWIIYVVILGFISVTKITINEFYMRFISYDVVNCNVDLTKTKQYRKSKDYIFDYNYYYNGKSYQGSDRIDNHKSETKIILSGKQDINLFVSPIYPSYSVLSKPTFNSIDDWFGMGVMAMLFFSIWALPLILYKYKKRKG